MNGLNIMVKLSERLDQNSENNLVKTSGGTTPWINLERAMTIATEDTQMMTLGKTKVIHQSVGLI